MALQYNILFGYTHGRADMQDNTRLSRTEFILTNRRVNTC